MKSAGYNIVTSIGNPKKEGKRVNKKAIIAMSGGVDSSVAAFIIKNADMIARAQR